MDATPTLRQITPDTPGVETGLAAPRPARLSLTLLIAAAFLLLVLGEAALVTTCPNTAWHAADLALVSRLAMLAADLLCLAAFVLAAGLPLGLLLKLADRWRIGRGFIMGLMFPSIFVLLLLAASSWVTRWHAGSFLTRAALATWLHQSVEAVRTADARLLLGLPLAVVALTGIIVGALPPVARHASPGFRRLVVGAAILTLLTCGALVGIAEALDAEWRNTHTGVFTHALMSP